MSERTIVVGKSARGGKVTVRIDIRPLNTGGNRAWVWRDGQLEQLEGTPLDVSICGDVWLPSGRDIESGGQIVDHILDDVATYAEGVTREKLARLVELWRRWHLNGMRPGCEHQTAEGWASRPIDPSKPTNAYGKHFEGQRSPSWNMLAWVTRAEHPEGLLSHPCPVCGYKYGSAWLYEPMPEDVLAELQAWPAEPK